MPCWRAENVKRCNECDVVLPGDCENTRCDGCEIAYMEKTDKRLDKIFAFLGALFEQL